MASTRDREQYNLFNHYTKAELMRNCKQNFWVKDHRQIYLIGNPVIWWNSTLAIVVYLVIRGLIVLREKRGFKDLRRREYHWSI